MIEFIGGFQDGAIAISARRMMRMCFICGFLVALYADCGGIKDMPLVWSVGEGGGAESSG